MGSRPLRHFYGDESARLEVDACLGSVVEPWSRHRERFLDELTSLTDDQWQTESRCAGWSNRDVICHLLDVDSFWTLSLESGRAGTPTAYLGAFDPKGTPLDLVNAKSAMSTSEVFDQFEQNTATFRKTVDSFTPDDWSSMSESPLGHVTSRLTLAHALWDSWLHERDILEPLGLTPAPDAEELNVATWYTLFFGAAQGGLIGDESPVGPGATEPIEAQLQFDEAVDPVRVVIGTDVSLGAATDPVPAGSAVGFIEGLTGRIDAFPPDDVDATRRR